MAQVPCVQHAAAGADGGELGAIGRERRRQQRGLLRNRQHRNLAAGFGLDEADLAEAGGKR